MNQRILVIDDDPDILNAYHSILAPDQPSGATADLARLLAPQAVPPHDNFALMTVNQGQQGIKLVKESIKEGNPFAVAFIDVRMPPGRDGIRVAAEIRKLDPNVELVIVTAYSDRSREEIVSAIGDPDKLLLLRKPFDPEEVQQLARCLCDKWNLARQARKQTHLLTADTDRFHELTALSREWVWEIDLDGTFTYCSPGSVALYGYTPEELLGRNAFDLLVPGGEHAAQRAHLAKIRKSKQPGHLPPHRAERRDGVILEVETVCVPVLTNNRVVGFRGISRDITERVQAERSLEKSRSTSRGLLSTPVDAVLLITPDGTIAEANETARRLVSVAQEELLQGQSLWQLLPPVFAKRCRDNTAKVVRKKEVIRAEDRVGNTWYDTVFSPLLDENGAVAQVAIWARDKSEMKGLELRLELKTRELLEVNNALKILLQQSTEAIAEHDRKVHDNLHRLVFPYLERLRDKYPDDEIQLYLNVALSNLEKINSTFSLAISSRLKGLTPRELQVAELLKQGKNTKEIATLLKLSARTVEFYRDKLRVKLGLKNKKENLRSHLAALG
ncbi:MAG: PAS domain S-box protein [Thermodesulfobacteriota bacterium]